MMPHVPAHETAPLSPAQKATAADLIEAALKIPAIRPEPPKSYRDPTPPQPTGAQPVKQDDRRIVPEWAVGVAVSGIGIGVMSIGVGLGAKLFFESVTTEGVIVISLIISAPLLLISAAGAALSKVKKATPDVTNNFHGTVSIKNDNRTAVQNTNKAFSFNRTRIEEAQ
ncbi:hypothetical protein FE633_13200 [Streptomyces montanus]|uniref:Uncharacterized protein n=1 Tax=Streptomyces montanus TaxID=2580423 RepID=A0A5R9FSU2_9ACTN|nr:hypothetical protein [Streptomyces montanus]TLS45719.1 hypothetical protein FE633_13200 [Streptomyces montanus]